MNMKKALTILYDCAEQTLDKEGFGPGDWPELEEAMRTVGPQTQYGPNYKGISLFGEKGKPKRTKKAKPKKSEPFVTITNIYPK